MKGINDVRNMCIIKCITHQYLIEIMLIKGDNSGLNEITYNYGKLCQNHLILPKISLCHNQGIQTTLEG